MMGKIFGIALVFLLVGSIVGGLASVSNNVVSADEVVTFPDPNLEAAICDAIGKPMGDIYQSDLNNLTSLNAHSRNIANLSGLEHCTSLTQLDIGKNGISDISPLSGLTGLTELSLGYNQISDVSPLANLTSLTELSLRYNQISDVSPLANLTNLTELSLRYNQISDISPLANLTSLTRLSLFDNQISDISPLANLTNLTELSLRYNQISDIKPLVDNPGLSEGNFVDLRSNPLSATSISTYIPQLKAMGVRVLWSIPTAVSVSIDSPGEVPTGGNFTASVNITDVADLDAYQLDVSYNSTIIEIIDVTDGLIDLTPIPVDMWGFRPWGTQGTIRVLGNVLGVAGVSGSGYLAEIHFHVVGECCNNSDISFSSGTLFDNMASEIWPTWLDDSVHVCLQPGDASGDCAVNMADVTRVEGIILGLDPATPCADANQNGVIDMADITKIEKIILGLD